MHESSEEFEVQPDRTKDGALWRLKKSPWTYNWENGVATFSQLFLIRSFSYLQYKNLDEFEIRPDLTRDYRVSCP